MTTKPAAEADAATPERPRSVDFALVAIIIECLLAVGSALALRNQEGWVREQLLKNKDNQGKTTAQLHQLFHDTLRSSLILALVGSIVALVIAKFIRDGKGWSRWVYTVLTVVPFLAILPSHVFNVLVLLASDAPALYRILTGLSGLAAIAAVVFLFLPDSARYFRRSTASGATQRLLLGRPRGDVPSGPTFGGASGFGALFKSRMLARTTGTVEPAAGDAASGPKADVDSAAGGTVVLDKGDTGRGDSGSSDSETGNSGAGATKRATPRAKSRKTPAE